MPPTALISSRIFLAKQYVDPEILSRHYEVPLYNEAACGRCPVFKEGSRHSDEHCTPCAAFKGVMQLWRERRFNRQDYIALPPGRPRRIEQLFKVDLSRAEDLRPEIPVAHDLQFIGKLYRGEVIAGRQTVDQVKMVADWLHKKSGIIEVPPRGGKTVIAAAIVCHLGVKTLIVAHEGQLLRQFRRTFMGSKKYPAQTNARQLARRSGQPVVKIIDKLSDFQDYPDVALITYQKFIRASGKPRIKKYLNNKYSLLVVDECHMQGALRYAQFIARLNMRYRCGLSATVDRKDGQSLVIKEYLGNTVAKSHTTALIPQIELLETSIAPKYNYKSWVYAMKFLAQHKAREKLIVQEVFKDLRANHTIIIPVDFVQHGRNLVTAINNQAAVNNDKRQESWPDETAVLYSNQIKNPADLKKILGRVDSGRHRVLVAIRSKIKMGVDLSTPTMLYCVVPMSASGAQRDDGSVVGAPMFYQLSHRVSTWLADKQQPVVKIFVDALGQSFGCFKSLWWKEIMPGLRHSERRPAKYKIAQPDFQRAMQIAQLSREQEYAPPGKPGQRLTSAEILGERATQAQENSPGRGFLAARRAR